MINLLVVIEFLENFTQFVGLLRISIVWNWVLGSVSHIAVSNMLSLRLSSVVLFSSFLNARYMGLEDEITLSKHCGWHDKLVLVV